MPFPVLILALPELISAIVAVFAAAYGLFKYTDGKSLDEIKSGIERMIIGWVVAEAAKRTGLELDENDPLSDASFCHAIERKTGVMIRTLKDKNSVVEDFEAHALGQIEIKTGFRLSTLRDPEQMKHDIANIGLNVVTQKTGIPLAPLTGTPGDWGPQVKDQLLTWAEAQLRNKLASDAAGVAGKIGEFVDLDALAGQINKRLADIGSTQDVDVRGLALNIAEQVAAGAVNRFQVQAKEMTKGTRRTLQNREAQRRFRAKWGDRRVYNPVPVAGGGDNP